jgi:uncharacterized membrane protein YdbT with pleckstrin-like domain
MIRNSGILMNQIKGVFPFHLVSEEILSEYVAEFDLIEISDGTTIFSIGEMADALFFVLSGNIKLQPKAAGVALANAPLIKGDRFGEEVIRGPLIRASSATCVGQTRLLSINHDLIQRMIKEVPELRAAFLLFHQSWQASQKLRLPWLTTKESVQLICRRHKIVMIFRLAIFTLMGLTVFSLLLFAAFTSENLTGLLLVLAVAALVGGVLTGIWAAVEWANDYFILTDDRVLTQRQLYGFFDSRQESPLSAILSTGFDTTLIGRILGYGKVHLRSYTGEISFNQLPYPHAIFDLLEFQRERVTADKKAIEKRVMKDTLTQRLNGNVETDDTIPINRKADANSTTIYQSGSFMDFLARFFQLRQDKEGAIIYRTHWWILLQKTIFPFIILMFLLMVIIFRMLGLFTSIPEITFYTVGLVLTLITALWWFYQYVDWYFDQYILTHDQLIDVSRKPLGYEDRRSAPVKNIQTVEFKRKGLIGLLLNFGTVKIQIGNEELTFDNVYAPSQIQGEIYLHLKNYQEYQQKQEQERLADWIRTYDDLKRPVKEDRPAEE